MNKQQLAAKIWASANKMRSKIEANEYKDYILGFIFYKFLSEQEVKFLKANDFTEDDIQALDESDLETCKYIQRGRGYFIEYKNLFSTWIDQGADFTAAEVTDALNAFDRWISPQHKKVFSGIFDTLRNGLSKLGETSGARTKAISDLIHLINDIPMDGRQDYDVLGYIYEYLIEKFASNAGKKAGEFYTPHEVSLLMSEIVAHHLRGKDEIKIYDPTSGSGSLLINIGRAVAKHSANENGIKYYAQELKENTYNLTRMNLVMRGILPDNIVTRCGDTLEEDWPYFDESDPVGTYDPLYVDAVVSNPPYSQDWDPSGKESDPRYRYGLAPKSKADYAFLLHDLYHLRPEGVMTIVLPHGVLFRGGEEGEIRRNLVENHHIEAIIGLPANIFYGTGIPTIIMVLRQKREASDVLIIDASKHFAKEGKNNKLRASDIKRIVDVVKSRCNVDKFSRVVSLDEIRANDYNLNIPRYVDSSEAPESWDIYASMFGGIPKAELDAFAEYWTAWPTLKSELFADSGTPYVQLKAEDVKRVIAGNADVRAFKERYAEAFADMPGLLHAQLINGLESVNAVSEEQRISEQIFERLAHTSLIDRYKAYQELDDSWQGIAADLEVLQSEGMVALTTVDPNMVEKNKKEVQDGWAGRVLPFGLVQECLLATEVAAIDAKESRLSEVGSELEELLESFSEEEKGGVAFNEAGDAFAAAEVKKLAKAARKGQMGEFEEKIVQAQELLDEQKSLKSAIKKDTEALHLQTKEVIEGLSEGAAIDLLGKKWIDPLMDKLLKLPDAAIDDFAARVQKLSEKYAVTYSSVVDEIRETEQSLLAMLDDLTGDEYDMRGIAEFKRLLGGE